MKSTGLVVMISLRRLLKLTVALSIRLRVISNAKYAGVTSKATRTRCSTRASVTAQSVSSTTSV